MTRCDDLIRTFTADTKPETAAEREPETMTFIRKHFRAFLRLVYHGSRPMWEWRVIDVRRLDRATAHGVEPDRALALGQCVKLVTRLAVSR
jgi:hypothetical protein